MIKTILSTQSHHKIWHMIILFIQPHTRPEYLLAPHPNKNETINIHYLLPLNKQSVQVNMLTTTPITSLQRYQQLSSQQTTQPIAPPTDTVMIQTFLSKLKTPNDVQQFAQQMTQIFRSSLDAKKNEMQEMLIAQVKDKVEKLFTYIEKTEWNSEQPITGQPLSNQESQFLTIRNQLFEIFEYAIVHGNPLNLEKARNKLTALNESLSLKQKQIEGLIDETFQRISASVLSEIESAFQNVLMSQQQGRAATTQDKLITQSISNTQNTLIQQAKNHFDHIPAGIPHSDSLLLPPPNLPKPRRPYTKRQPQNLPHQDGFTQYPPANPEIYLNNQYSPGGHANLTAYPHVTKDEYRNMKREDDLKRTFRVASSDIENFQTFEYAEHFVEKIIMGRKNFIILSSTFKKVQQVFILRKEECQTGGTVPYTIGVSDVHLINCESIIQLHITWVPPCYAVCTLALHLGNVKLKVIVIDCQNGAILMKKDVAAPNPSQFKTYFSNPYFCMLFGRAKLLVLDVRQVVLGKSQDFSEIQTMLNFKQNYKIQIQPIHYSDKGPTDIIGLHYSSQSRSNEVYVFGMQAVTDPLQLKLWRSQHDPAIERQIAESGRLLVMGMKRADLRENEIPNKTYNYGTISLNAEKILIFGGISEQQGTSRDQCYVYDLKTRAIDKCADLFLKQKDSFSNDNFSYFEDEHQYLVAGRYYIHSLSKETLAWEAIDTQTIQSKSDPDLRYGY